MVFFKHTRINMDTLNVVVMQIIWCTLYFQRQGNEKHYVTELSSSQEPSSGFRRGRFFALFLVSTSTSYSTSYSYTSTYKFTVDCTHPGPFTYTNCPWIVSKWNKIVFDKWKMIIIFDKWKMILKYRNIKHKFMLFGTRSSCNTGIYLNKTSTKNLE